MNCQKGHARDVPTLTSTATSQIGASLFPILGGRVCSILNFCWVFIPDKDVYQRVITRTHHIGELQRSFTHRIDVFDIYSEEDIL
jgi:hypothetical protein